VGERAYADLVFTHSLFADDTLIFLRSMSVAITVCMSYSIMF
jgi:hypothetical protein